MGKMKKQQLRVLLVEDDTTDREAIERFVTRQNLPYKMEYVESKKELLLKLSQNKYDVILMDYNLPDTTGVELLEVVGDIPVIMVTGSGDERTAVESIHKGAYDYLVKDPNCNYLELLPTTIENVLAHKKAQEENKIMQEKLRHSQKLESLGVLAGGIAHDFNNILTSILGNSDLALDEMTSTSPVRNYIEEIQKGAKRAAELSHQMLAYSGKGKFTIESIDINEIIGEMTHILNVSISKKHTIRYDLAENLSSIEGDIAQINQIIMNLIMNASEAIGENSGVISIPTGAIECHENYFKKLYMHEDLPGGLYNYVEVADTGVGMDKETIERIFDPFFTTKFTGRGLGMSAVLGIIRGHKGAIKIESKLGKGTKFTVLFPSSGNASSTEKPETKESASAWQGSGTVLIVDDEKTVIDVGKRMLEKIGFSVITAGDGQEAVEIFRGRSNEIDCVLLDLTMPRMNGEECFFELRKIRKDIRVVIYSGYSEEENAQRFLDLGVNEFLQKPFRLKALKNKMRKVFESNRKTC